MGDCRESMRLAIALTLATMCVAQSSAPRSPLSAVTPLGYVCYRAASLIQVDGHLDDPAWRDAPWTDDFVDIEGAAKPNPPLRTRAKMLWNDGYFYIGAEIEEPHVWATLKAHDSVIFHDNDFEVFIDPDGDNHEYAEFEINALGTYWDLLLPRPYKDGGQAVNNWEIPDLQTGVAVDGTLNDGRDVDRRWTVEIAFPWSALGELARRPSPPRDGDQWRVNFSRVEWDALPVGDGYRKIAGRPEHNWVWSPQGVIDMHRPEMWGYVQFSTARPGTATFVPDASLPARRWLLDVYYAERAYRQEHQHWSSSLAELQVTAPSSTDLEHAQLGVAGSQFEASIDLARPGQPVQHWHIRQDSLIWED